MIYWIESMKDGSCLEGTYSYSYAVYLQEKIWREKNLDTYIRKENR